ncbi:MAG: hypothetical protein ABFR32_11405 [Bacteroidota bacterium]
MKAITLEVNTAEINQGNIEECCHFEGQIKGSPNKEFTTQAEVGDMIIWNGVSTTSENDLVNITFINWEDGKEIFGKRQLKGNDDEPELVVGKVLHNTLENDVDQNENEIHNNFKYKISFTVKKYGEENIDGFDTYKIDPKIQVNR